MFGFIISCFPIKLNCLFHIYKGYQFHNILGLGGGLILRYAKKSILIQVILAIIFCTIIVTFMISLILFNLSSTYVETYYEETTQSNRLNDTNDLLPIEEYQSLLFSRLIMLLIIAGVFSIYIAFTLGELITSPIAAFTEYVSRSAEANLMEPVSPALLNNENEIGTLAQSFDQMRLQILTSFDQKQEATSTLVRGVSHQLNTPLGNALSSVSFIEFVTENEKGLSPEYKEKIDEALDLTLSSLNQARDIIDLFKSISIHESEIEESLFNLSDFLSQYINLVGSDSKNNYLKFKVSIDENIYIKSYPNVIIQVINTLIANTRDHAYDAPYSDKCLIHIDAFKSNGKVHLIFKDFGKGIQEDVLPHIFEPFYTTKSIANKTGLGLSIAYNQVKKLEGTIECLAEKDGTAFILKLPSYGGAHDSVR